MCDKKEIKGSINSLKNILSKLKQNQDVVEGSKKYLAKKINKLYVEDDYSEDKEKHFKIVIISDTGIVLNMPFGHFDLKHNFLEKLKKEGLFLISISDTTTLSQYEGLLLYFEFQEGIE